MPTATGTKHLPELYPFGPDDLQFACSFAPWDITSQARFLTTVLICASSRARR